MPKMPAPFGEWRPDIANFDTQFANEALNVFAGVNSYKPFPTLQAVSGFLFADGDPPCGLYSARTKTGEWKIYGGTRSHLYTFNLGSGWTTVTRGSGAYTTPPGNLWMFEQSGHHLVAVNGFDAPQWIDIDVGTAFDDLPGKPPHATNVKQIGEFLFLSGLPENPTIPVTPGVDGPIPTNNRMIIWSGINDITWWVPGTALCDSQEFADGGPAVGVAGAEIGYVVQERTVRTLQFLPGDTTFIFNFTRVLHDRGSMSQYGFTSIGNVLYFLAEDGFYSCSGQQVVPIGADKVNDWFLVNSDITRRYIVHAIAGINKPRIAWAFHDFNAGSNPVYNHVILFDWSLAKWTHAKESAWVWGLFASANYDLDTDIGEPGDPDLDSTARELDSYAYIGGRPLIGAINTPGYLCALNGPNLAATLETADAHLSPGMRTFVSDVYIVGDHTVESVTPGTRERPQDIVTWGDSVPIEITGSAAVYNSARLHRFRVQIPAGAVWLHAQGAVADAQQDGTVA